MSSFEYLVIYSNSNFDELGSVLSYVPQLRRLSWEKLSAPDDTQVAVERITLKHLTPVSLKLSYIYFNQFEPLIIHLFHQLEVLHISTCFDKAYLDSDRWERLISSYISRLRVFDIEHRANCSVGDNLPLTCTSLNSLFTSTFWCDHRWFFTHQCFWQGNWNQVIFYSTNPSRRKDYILHGETDKDNCCRHSDTNLNVVRHVHIEDERAMMNCTSYFPNATEFTLLYGFDAGIDHTINYLNRIFSLTQLTRLYIDCGGFCFEKVIYLLQFISNVLTLRVYLMSFIGTDSVSIEKSESFQLVSNTNVMENFTVGSRDTFEQMELLVNLCPRLQHINMDIYRKNFDSIFELVLSKSNDNPRHLFSICLKNAYKTTVKTLMTLIESNKWLDDYSIEFIDNKLYL